MSCSTSRATNNPLCKMDFAIIAAGQGSRLVDEGISRPKPLVELDGRPMIGRLIDIFATCGARRVAVIVNAQMSEVADYLRSRRDGPEICLKVKTTAGSMESFAEVTSLLDDSRRFIVTTVDTIFREDDFKAYVDAFENADNECDGLMAVTSYIEDEKPLYVDIYSANSLILGFLDRPADGVDHVSGGIYGLTRPALTVLGKCVAAGVNRMRDYQRALIAAGLKLRAYDFPKIIDVDHASDIARAREFIEGE